jgi:hypothetical protein
MPRLAAAALALLPLCAGKHLPPKEHLELFPKWREETSLCLRCHPPPKKKNTWSFELKFCRDVKKNPIYLHKNFENFSCTGSIFYYFFILKNRKIHKK